MRTYRYLYFIIVLTFFSSCVTTGEKEIYGFFSIVPDEIPMIENNVEVPEVELFVSAPFSSEMDIGVFELSEIDIPAEDIPESIAVPEEKREDNYPVETVLVQSEPVPVQSEPVPAQNESVPAQNESTEVVERETVVEKYVPAEQVEFPVTAETPDPESVIEDEVAVTRGENFNIIIKKEGWIFENGESLPSLELKHREFNEDETVFNFLIERNGEYVLSFSLQNPMRGDEEKKIYKVIVEDPADYSTVPIVIDPVSDMDYASETLTEDSDIKLIVEEKNIPELVASFDQLVSDDAPRDSRILYDAFRLLEQQGGYDSYLVDLAQKIYNIYPYDNLSAEVLFTAAQAVESPGPQQDIEIALNLFRLVRDHFPLSIYSDKSEERIRYLERHFMKIY